ncbi:MAG: copper chaperone PCu(A)C [Metallibacterium sp.]
MNPHSSLLGICLLLAPLLASAAPPSLSMHAMQPARAASAWPTAPVAVTNAWVRWLPAGLPMGGYLRITNHGTHMLELVGARSASFGMVMLHESTHRGGMERMVHVDAVTIAPGATFAFVPGDYHLMLMHAADTVKPGGNVRIDLQFKGYAPYPVQFTVLPADAH